MVKIGIVFGGKSAEHEVSLASAKGVLTALQSLTDFKAQPIGIDKDGMWVSGPDTLDYLISKADKATLFVDQEREAKDFDGPQSTPPFEYIQDCDYIMPITQGKIGEDGRLQGFFEKLGKKIIGCGVLSSALCFDKTALKALIASHGFKVAPGLIIDAQDTTEFTESFYQDVCRQLGSDHLFIKPNDNGSSIGISQAQSYPEWKHSLQQAARYTDKILVEKFLDHREIVVGVIGQGKDLIISHLGDCITNAEVYTYEEKYKKGNELFTCPAELSKDLEEEIIRQTKEIYQLSSCSGWARVDFFIENGTNDIYLNEINTIPGMTEGSVFPKVFKSAGYSYPQLIQTIIDQFLESEKQEEKAAA